MQTKLQELSNSFELSLKSIERSNKSSIDKARQVISLSTQCLTSFKKTIENHRFDTLEDEIHFFKVIKPKVLSSRIFYFRLFQLEIELSSGNHLFQKKLIENELQRIDEFFKKNLDFCQYFHAGINCFDDKYFVRGRIDTLLLAGSLDGEADPMFTTGYDIKVAQIKAYDRLVTYLNIQLENLNKPRNTPEPFYLAPLPRLQWTGTKIALVELIYALHASGSVNNGDIEIKELAQFFENIFQFELGEFYRDFTQIKNRQKPTRFMEELSRALVLKINE